LGRQQARETGAFLDKLLADDGVTAENITWLSSPFLRTLQTSNEAISQFRKTPDAHSIRILPESSVFEWDGKNGQWHASLPPIAERIHYFPRLDINHQSLFIPTIPEPRSVFHARCDRTIGLLSQRFPAKPRTAIVIVTHAAACISMVRAATKKSLADVTPAAPCSIYKLTRKNCWDYQNNAVTHESAMWTIDAHDEPNGMNGYTAHLSDMGTNTNPWNHFGDKQINKGYTGPKSSRFAPCLMKSGL
jgi:broad specificity phosphatase PhoE